MLVKFIIEQISAVVFFGPNRTCSFFVFSNSGVEICSYTSVQNIPVFIWDDINVPSFGRHAAKIMIPVFHIIQKLEWWNYTILIQCIIPDERSEFRNLFQVLTHLFKNFCQIWDSGICRASKTEIKHLMGSYICSLWQVSLTLKFFNIFWGQLNKVFLIGQINHRSWARSIST